MHPVVADFGIFSIKAYGVFMAAAFLCGLYFLGRKTRAARISDDDLHKMFLWIIVAGLGGARLLYVATEGRFSAGLPLEVFRIWEGGLHYYGGLAAAIAAVVIFSMRHRGFPMWTFADAAAPSLALGLAVGKIGCFFAGCCFGKECNYIWGVTFTDPDSMAVRGIALHPVQIYESLAYFSVFLFSELMYYYRKSEGELFFFTVFLLSFARFHIELLRWDSPAFFGLTVGGASSVVAAAVSLAFMFVRRSRSSPSPGVRRER